MDSLVNGRSVEDQITFSGEVNEQELDEDTVVELTETSMEYINASNELDRLSKKLKELRKIQKESKESIMNIMNDSNLPKFTKSGHTFALKEGNRPLSSKKLIEELKTNADSESVTLEWVEEFFNNNKVAYKSLQIVRPKRKL